MSVGDLGFFAIGATAVVLLAIQAVEHPSQFAQVLVFGLADGAIYALVALGYTMVYGIIELINFAHGDVFTLGAYIGATLMGFFASTSEDSFLLEGLMFLWHGPATVHVPDLLPHGPGFQTTIGGVFIAFKDVFVVIAAAILVSLLAVFINRSKLGKAMRATAQDRDASQLMGININRTIAATFFIGALLAGAGGMIWGLYFNNLFYNLGFRTGLVAFTSAVFGGIGNIPGAAIGGVLIGLIAVYSDSYIGSKWTEVVIFGILIGVLVFRPTGLLGMRVPEK